jgi:flagellar motor switch protein FliN/FliY
MPDTAPTATPPPAGEAPAVVAKHPEFPTLEPGSVSKTGTTLDSLRDVPITITAKLGHATLPISDILKLGPGAVVELEEAISTPVELTVRGVPFAVGEVIVIDDHFAVRIKSLLPPRTGKAEK